MNNNFQANDMLDKLDGATSLDDNVNEDSDDQMTKLSTNVTKSLAVIL